MVSATVVLALMMSLGSSCVQNFVSMLAVAGLQVCLYIIYVPVQMVADNEFPLLMPCRSLDAYWEYAQIDVKERVANSAEKFCHKRVKKREPEPEESRPEPAVKQKKKPEKRSLRSMLSVHITGFRRR